MAFKLQLTDEMIRFFRTSQLSDADAGCLIRLLIDAAEERELPTTIPQPLTYTLPIFLGQVEAFRENYNRKAEANADRQRRFRQNIPPDEDLSRVTRVTGVTQRYEALRALPGVTGVTNVTGVTERDTRCHTSPDHTRPNQNKSTVSSSRSFGRSEGPDGSDGRPDGIDSYDQIFDARNDPVGMAVGICQESRPRMAAAGYARQRARIGDDAFRAVLAAFWGEIQAGEEPRNRGAAFTARLKEQADFDPQDAEAARKAVAALNTQPEEQTP